MTDFDAERQQLRENGTQKSNNTRVTFRNRHISNWCEEWQKPFENKRLPYKCSTFWIKCLRSVTWNFDVGLPSVVVASGIKLHVSSEGIGVDREAVGDDLPPRSYSKTGLRLVVFPKKGEGNPWGGGREVLSFTNRQKGIIICTTTAPSPSGPHKVGSLMQEFW